MTPHEFRTWRNRLIDAVLDYGTAKTAYGMDVTVEHGKEADRRFQRVLEIAYEQQTEVTIP